MFNSTTIVRALGGTVVLFAATAALGASGPQSAAAQGVARSDVEAQKVVCRDIARPNSRIIEHVCKTPAQWEQWATALAARNFPDPSAGNGQPSWPPPGGQPLSVGATEISVGS